MLPLGIFLILLGLLPLAFGHLWLNLEPTTALLTVIVPGVSWRSGLMCHYLPQTTVSTCSRVPQLPKFSFSAFSITL
jgi:hypothetical protein